MKCYSKVDYKLVKIIDLDLQLFSIVKDLLIIKLLHANLIMQATLNLQFRRCPHYKPDCEWGFKTYSGGVTKVKTIVTHSLQAHCCIRATQGQMGLEELKLKQDAVTTWNFTFYMLQRFWQQKYAIVAKLGLVSPTLPMLSPDE